MTQLELAKSGGISFEMKRVAADEGVTPEFIQQGVADGTIVIPSNKKHKITQHCGIGKGLKIKVNANIGTSADSGNKETELEKLKVAVEYKSDTVMDLSTGGDLQAILKAIIANSPIPVGTVPIYQAALGAIKSKGALVNMTADDLFGAIEEHGAAGVDFITVHCGVTRASIDRLKKQGRVTDIVSRGGAILLGWILHNKKENPLYEQYDRLLDIAKRHDVTLSLGDGLRPGSIVEATDRAQVEELIILGELVARARAAGVQAMVEGPGHVPLHQIAANIELEKSLCQGAPFYVLGPLVTDIAAGYDHITGAIGGAIAAMAGADFLCYVTPSEHLGLPGTEDVRQGVMASRIAAHAADIARGVKGAREIDRKMSAARKSLNWEEQAKLALDPAKVRSLHKKNTSSGDTCTMCGGMCAMKLVSEYLGGATGKC